MTARRMLAAVLIAIAATACDDDSPTGPSVDLSGRWTGTLTFVTSGVTVTDNVSTTLSQSGSSVTGGWTTLGGTQGQFTLTAAAEITGATTISHSTITGQPCTASTSVTGTATSTRLELSLAPVTQTGVCQWAANQQMVLTR